MAGQGKKFPVAGRHGEDIHPTVREEGFPPPTQEGEQAGGMKSPYLGARLRAFLKLRLTKVKERRQTSYFF